MGARWSLNLLGDWAWRRGAVLVTDSQQPELEDTVWGLCGLDLVGFTFPAPPSTVGTAAPRGETQTFSRPETQVVQLWCSC